MRELVATKAFTRQFKRVIGKNPKLIAALTTAFQQLQSDPFQPSLGTHKLKGKLNNRWASSAGYDLRLIFRFEVTENEAEAAIILLDVGKHDDVY